MAPLEGVGRDRGSAAGEGFPPPLFGQHRDSTSFLYTPHDPRAQRGPCGTPNPRFPRLMLTLASRERLGPTR